MNNIVRLIVFVVVLLDLVCCVGKQTGTEQVVLTATERQVSFRLNNDTKQTIKSLFLHTDKDGADYLTFQNPDNNAIYFYRLDSGELLYKIPVNREGPNGVGRSYGYYVKSEDSIYLTAASKPILFLINKEGVILNKYNYGKTKDDIPLFASYSTSFTYHPIVEDQNKLYLISQCNRQMPHNPVSFTIDKETSDVEALPLSYPVYSESKNLTKAYSSEIFFSRCFNGSDFIYSFFYDPDIYVASSDHRSVNRKSVTSRYINQIKIPDEHVSDFQNSMRQMCSNPNYGNLLYDKYRDVYYRVCYPQTEIEPTENLTDLWQYGRSLFSILVLNNEFETIGEVLMPDGQYISTLMFITKEGLYISNSHYKNKDYNENVLGFRLFKLEQAI